MSRAEDRLEQTARLLAEKGDDAKRLELVQRARRFKRSWVEMAEGLIVVRDSGAFRRWGFADLYAYCAEELQLRGSTVDKLLGSYSTLRTHAPEVLRRDGVAQAIPTVEAVDYFAKAVEPRAENDQPFDEEPDPDLISDLKRAVFDEAKPLQAIRRHFNPLLNPKPEAVMEQETAAKLHTAVRRIRNLMAQLPTLPAAQIDEMEQALQGLEGALQTVQAATDAA